MDKSIKVLIIAVALLLLTIVLSPFVIISAGSRGVITHFGKVEMEKVLGEGFHWRTPIFTTVHSMTVQIQKSEIKASGATKDLQTVNVVLAINWKLDPNKVNLVYQSIGNEDDVLGDIMTPAVNEVVKASTARRSAQTILVERTQLKTEIDEAFKLRMEKYGIVVVDVSLVDFQFSEGFQKAIEEKQVAEQEAQKADYVAKQAEAEARAEVNRAVGASKAQELQRQTLSGAILKKMWIEKWDGHLPQVTSGNSGGLILDMKSMTAQAPAEEEK